MEKAVKNTPGTCAFCGKENSVRKGRKFCSMTCSAQGIRQRTMNGRPFCAFCGENKLMGRQRRFCSVSCQQKAHSLYMLDHSTVYSSMMLERHAKDSSLRESASLRMRDKNPMRMLGVIAKVMETKQRNGFVPLKKRGGNGCDMPVPQRVLLEALGDGWIAEFVVLTSRPKNNPSRLPNCYKIDVAHPMMKLAIEVDGYSHSVKTKDRDAKKDRFLREKGWLVLRLRNERILSDLDSALMEIALMSSI